MQEGPAFRPPQSVLKNGLHAKAPVKMRLTFTSLLSLPRHASLAKKKTMGRSLILGPFSGLVFSTARFLIRTPQKGPNIVSYPT